MLRSTASLLLNSNYFTRAHSGLASAAVIITIISGSTFAQDSAYDIPSHTQSGGGGISSGSDFVIEGTIGLVVAGPMQGGEFHVLSGFLPSESLLCEQADFNCDSIVDGADLSELLHHWGPCPDSSTRCVGDINHDGIVDGVDLGQLLVHWG